MQPSAFLHQLDMTVVPFCLYPRATYTHVLGFQSFTHLGAKSALRTLDMAVLRAQEQEYRNNKFNENQHHENKKVRGPSGATSPLKVWIPPLRVERLETDGLPKALAGVDIGTLLALAQTKEAFKHAGAARYAAATYRSACSASSKEARWATNLCGGRSDIAHSHTNPHPAYFTRPITTAGDKRRKFLAEYAQRTSGAHSPDSHTLSCHSLPTTRSDAREKREGNVLLACAVEGRVMADLRGAGGEEAVESNPSILKESKP